MRIELTIKEKEELESQYSKERDRRVADRIKAVLLNAEGWTQKQIAQALRIRYETVQDHLNDYRKNKKLKGENGGSESHLPLQQTVELIQHLEVNTYLKVEHICAYVQHVYGVGFTVSGMTKWLTRNKFSFKKPKGTPAKADPDKQATFIKYYEDLMNTLPEDEPVEFLDAVHPTMATKITYGWIRQGKKNDKLIKTTASRSRLNLLGSLNLESMEIAIATHETIDSKAMEKHFASLRKKYPKAPKIHQILDNGPYNRSQETKEAAKKYGILLHYLPTYSPNLNPIERVWKVLNEFTRNNRVFTTVSEFKTAIFKFFQVTWPEISASLVNRITDNFQILNKAS